MGFMCSIGVCLFMIGCSTPSAPLQPQSYAEKSYNTLLRNMAVGLDAQDRP